MDNKKLITGMVIHGYAVAHAMAAALFAQSMVGDEAILTALTIAMILSVASVNGAKWTKGMAYSFLGVFAGGYIGVRLATFMIKWVPGIGNGANAASTIMTTEILGWATYLFLASGRTNPRALSKQERKELLKEAKKLSKANREESKRYYESMSQEDRDECERILKQLQNKDLSDSTKELLTARYNEIIKNAAVIEENK